MIQQSEFTLRQRARGFHLITDEVIRHLPLPLPEAGMLNLFIKHSSAGLSINENADPDVQTDLESIFDRLVKERESYYTHTCEGVDDMPAHAKSTIVGVSLRSCLNFFHACVLVIFLMCLDFLFAVNSGLLTRKEDSKAQKRTKDSMNLSL